MSIAFVLTTLVVVATPGTGALYTITVGLSRGPRASLVAAAGAPWALFRTWSPPSPVRLPC